MEDVVSFLEQKSMADVLICIGDMESREGGICKTEVVRMFPNETTVFKRIKELISEGFVMEGKGPDGAIIGNRMNLYLTERGRKLADMILRFRKEWDA